jgi:hypothetical protein
LGLFENCLHVAFNFGFSAAGLSEHSVAYVAVNDIDGVAENQLFVAAFGTFYSQE